MTPLPKHLEEMQKFWIVETNIPVESMRVAAICESHSEIYANHWNSPHKPIEVVERAAIDIMLKDMEEMAKALEKYASREFWSYGVYNKYENSIAIEALKIWREKYGGKK